MPDRMTAQNIADYLYLRLSDEFDGVTPPVVHPPLGDAPECIMLCFAFRQPDENGNDGFVLRVSKRESEGRTLDAIYDSLRSQVMDFGGQSLVKER